MSSLGNIFQRSLLKFQKNKLDCSVIGWKDFTDKRGHNSDDEGHSKSQKLILPEEPTNCCMSGCANCVWIDYAQDLIEKLGDNGEAAREKIIENVKDPSLRAFLLMELDNLLKSQGKE